MNVIWIVADTFRWDRVGAYGNDWIKTPALDTLAAQSVRFDRHYVSSFPTVPARADHHTGQWTMSFMGWEPLPAESITLADILSERGYVTAAVVDTPYYIRDGMNFDRGFQGFYFNPSQDASLIPGKFKIESNDLRAELEVGGGPCCTTDVYLGNAMAAATLQGELFPLYRHVGPSRTLGRTGLLHRVIYARLRW